MIRKEHKPTQAQKIYGRRFDNVPILCERPDDLRSSDPNKDKFLFMRYKHILRQQVKTIKNVLR